MRTLLVALLLVVTMLISGIVGWCLGTINMQESAIAQGVATWEPIKTDGVRYTNDGYKQATDFEFRWLTK